MLLDLENPTTCPICLAEAKALPPTTRRTTIHCPNCIEFTITFAADTPDDPELRNLLSAAARRAAEAGHPLTLTQDSIREFIQAHSRNASPAAT
jgi:predicted RNA-binding Zn-ribbon protein involved in translation (DUF1610 family)